MRISTPLAICSAACAVVASTVVSAQVTKTEVRTKTTTEEPNPKRPAAVREAVKTEAVLRQQMVPAIGLRQGAMNKAALAQQVTQQLRPFLRVEYHFIRKVCEPSPEQRGQIARAGERALRETAAQYPNGNLNAAQVIVMGRNGMATQSFNDPIKPIRDGLAKAVEQFLTPEQAARYKDEVKRKNEHWKQVAVRTIVTRLDQDLLLTADQRAAIGDSLRDHWNETWASSVTALVNIEHYFPPIPDEHIMPSLDAAQKDIWQALQVNRRLVRFGIGANRLDDGPEDQELTEARQAEDKAGSKE